MERTIMIILVASRTKNAAAVQGILTDWGCSIRTRLGLHDAGADTCSTNGLIILELVGDPARHKELEAKLSGLTGVSTRLVTLSVTDELP